MSIWKFTPILFYFLVLRAGIMYAQTFSLKGQLREENGAPVPGATVVVDSDKIITTDPSGNFKFSGLKKGNYLVKISCLGFEKIEKKISIPENVELKIFLKAASINLSEVRITPGKTNAQSEIISAVDMQLRPVSSAQDLLRLVPGLFIAQHAGGGKAEQIFLRGFDCDHGTDFFISVDGMPVNMVSHAHGQGYADFHFVIPETIDRLAVYKGPYTTRFGDFSTSGTGEFFTKNSIEKNEVKLEYGMFDTYRALGMIKLLDEKHLFAKEKENAYVAGEYVFTNSYFDQKQNFGRLNLFGKYSGTLNQRNYLSFSASTFSAQWDASGQVPERAVEEGMITRFGSIDPSEGGQTRRTNINSVLTTTLENNSILKNQVYYVNYFFNLYSDFTFFLNDPVHGDEINQTDKRNIFGYNGSWQKDFYVRDYTIHGMAGAGTRNDFTHISLKHTESRLLLDTISSGNVTQQNTNGFLDATIEFSKHLSLNAGIRFDYFSFQYTDDRYDSLSGTKSILRGSPKLNLYYTVNERIQFFLKSGIGFHSNDARSVVINHVENSLPKAYGAEAGIENKLTQRLLVNVAFWYLYLQSELVYVGDEGTVETNNPTQRYGSDVSIRYQINRHLFADLDVNASHGRLLGAPEGKNRIPLAPSLTSTGGLNYKKEKGLNASLRYRFIDSRPANEINTVIAKGYLLFDAVLNYKWKKFDVGISAENLLNTQWNQAQFDTESRLQNESVPVSELHFTPGTPFFIKGTVAVRF